MIVGVRIVLRSTDADEWVEIPNVHNGSIRGVAATESDFVAVGDDYAAGAGAGVVLSSPDGITWSKRTTPTPLFLNGVTAEAGRVIAVGYSGSILTSSNGRLWTERGLGSRTPLHGVFRGPDAAVAVGEKGVIVTSTGGSPWISQVSGTDRNLRGVTFARDTWVVVGNAGTILTSKNGRDWTPRQTNPSVGFSAVTYAQGLFVAVGGEVTGARIWISPDGEAWSDRSPMDGPGPFNDPLWDVIYTPEHQAFVAVGESTVMVSTSGRDWRELQPVTGLVGFRSSLAFGAGKFVVVGPSGAYSSTNAQDWIPVPHILFQGAQLRSVTYSDGAFWVSGDAQTSALLLRSTDGIDWEPVAIQASPGLNGLSKGGNGLLAAGDSGTILERVDSSMPPTLSSSEGRFLADGSYAFTMDSAPGTTLSIERSEDLRSWTSSQSVTNPLGRIEIVDPDPGSPRRFYRATAH